MLSHSRTARLVSKPVVRPLPSASIPIRTRNDSDDEGPSRPKKRTKNKSDSDIDDRTMGDFEKVPQLIREEVRCALEQHAQGDDDGYLCIKKIYASKRMIEDEPSTAKLRLYTMALLGNVSSLNRSRSELVHTVLNSKWLGRNEDYATLFVRFTANLASTQGVFLVDVLQMLVDNLTAALPSNGRSPDSPLVPRSKIFLRVHSALHYLLQLIPSASTVLSSVLTNAFPHQTDSKRSHGTYVHNILRILSYAPELRAEVLALITERLVKIDVQVQVDLEDLAEDVGEGVVQDIPRMQSNFEDILDDSESSGDESVISSDADNREAGRTKEITKNVEKMDIVLDLLFNYYSQVISEVPADAGFGTLDILLSQFVTIILPTQRSRHTQFLLFHFSQLSPSFIDTFVGTCVQIAFDKVQPAIVRQAAAAYLASYVARGNHVTPNIVRDVFSYIGAELEGLRSIHEPTCRGPDVDRYSAFYHLMQALLYIFCYRWRDLQFNPEENSDDSDFEEDVDESLPAIYASGKGPRWYAGVKDILASNVFSKLNPLRVCCPAVVTEFARVANHLGILFVYHLLETNKRVQLSQFAHSANRSSVYSQPERETALSARRHNESHQLLDGFFPFDPYHLPISKRWISGDYREWKGVPGLDDEEERRDSQSDDEEEGSNIEDDDDEETETDRSETPRVKLLPISEKFVNDL